MTMGIFKLSWHSMRYNKRKTLLTIFTVALSACLMTVIFQYLYGSRAADQAAAVARAGAYHAHYENLSQWQLGQLMANDKVKAVQCPSETGGNMDAAGGYTADVLLKSNLNCKASLEALEHSLGIQPDQRRWNMTYLDAFNVDGTYVATVAGIVMGIVFVSAIVVYNIFYIYVLQEIRLFGMMKAMGFTNGQLRRFLLLEGGAAGGLGSLMGVAAGGALSRFILPGLMSATAGAVGPELKYILGLDLAAFVLGFAVVMAGIWRPMKIISGISEIEAMNYNPLGGRKIHKSPHRPKDRVRLWDLIRVDLAGNWKRSRWAVASIVVTGVLFLTAASIARSMDLDNLVRLSIRGDFCLKLTEAMARDKSSQASLSPDLIVDIEGQAGVAQVDTIMYDRCLWNTGDAKKHIRLTDEYTELGIGFSEIDSVLYGYDDALMEECLNDAGAEPVGLDAMINNDYAIVVADDQTDFQLNDIVRFQMNGKETAFKIVGILQDNLTYRGYRGAGNDFIIHQARFGAKGLDTRLQRAAIVVDRGARDRIGDYLTALTGANDFLELEDRQVLLASYGEEKRRMELASYGLSIFLFLIAVFNLMNSSLSYIFSRKRELAMLEAVGMTQSQVGLMLQAEGLILVMVGSGLAVLLGWPLGYGAFLMFRHSASYAVYGVPVAAMVVLPAAFMGVQVAITAFARRWLSREGIVAKINGRGL